MRRIGYVPGGHPTITVSRPTVTVMTTPLTLQQGVGAKLDGHSSLPWHSHQAAACGQY